MLLPEVVLFVPKPWSCLLRFFPFPDTGNNGSCKNQFLKYQRKAIFLQWKATLRKLLWTLKRLWRICPWIVSSSFTFAFPPPLCSHLLLLYSGNILHADCHLHFPLNTDVSILTGVVVMKNNSRCSGGPVRRFVSLIQLNQAISCQVSTFNILSCVQWCLSYFFIYNF